MKCWTVKIAFICLLLGGAASGLDAQSNGSKGSGQGSSITPNSNIPASILHEVLTLAAPHFNLTPAQFIQLYYTCRCVTVEQIGPNVYRVSYGGIGIQIVIDATRKTRGWLPFPVSKS